VGDHPGEKNGARPKARGRYRELRDRAGKEYSKAKLPEDAHAGPGSLARVEKGYEWCAQKGDTSESPRKKGGENRGKAVKMVSQVSSRRERCPNFVEKEGRTFRTAGMVGTPLKKERLQRLSTE